MAESNVERKGPIWPWILAAIIVLLLIWLLIRAFDVGVDTVPTAATAPATPAGTAALSNDPAMAPAATTDAATPSDPGTGGLAGMYSGSNTQLALDADGTYSMQESPADEARGTWTHDAGANALRLKPGDGSQERLFRIESNDTLMPLNAAGEPAGQTARLARQAAQ